MHALLNLFDAGVFMDLPYTGQTILIEAESFEDYGGWLMDQQSLPSIGSAYLLAHGLGRPVVNAKTRITNNIAGVYHLWVRTRDWVAPHGPGRFTLILNGSRIDKDFGAGGDGSWQWHYGGHVTLPAGISHIELQDLTGFEGRCDAIALTEHRVSPPNFGNELADFRRQALGISNKPEDGGTYDLIVAGGGFAGVCCAIAAARGGIQVLLIQDRPVLGGNASSEIRVGPIGGIGQAPYPHNADIIREILSSPGAKESSGGLRARPNDAWVHELLSREKNMTLQLETSVIGVEKNETTISAIITRHLRTSHELRFRGRLFADCTGDATLGCLAGANWRIGRESANETGESLAPLQVDKQVLGCTNLWYADKTNQPSSFPPCPWAIHITEESRDISTPKHPPDLKDKAFIGGWNWESGFDRDASMEAEFIRDHNFRVMYGMWDFLKNRAHDRASYAYSRLEWAAHLAGKRESRRLMGDLILTEQDIRTPNIYPDACVTATWYFDAHFPHPENTKHFPGQEFRSVAYDDPNFETYRGAIRGSYTTIKPYPIPFRCLYSRNIDNLLMAGRNISVTHVALLPVRTMNTTAMMGTVVGRAAVVCCEMNILPRILATRHLNQLKEALSKSD